MRAGLSDSGINTMPFQAKISRTIYGTLIRNLADLVFRPSLKKRRA
jgi:hypothetical protein